MFADVGIFLAVFLVCVRVFYMLKEKESVRSRVVKTGSAFVREGQIARGEGAKWLLVGKPGEPFISPK